MGTRRIAGDLSHRSVTERKESWERLVSAAGIELEPQCGRMSPQAKSRAERGDLLSWPRRNGAFTPPCRGALDGNELDGEGAHEHGSIALCSATCEAQRIPRL